MGAIVGGMALHGGVIPYAATFLTFADYMRPPMRLAALMGLRVVCVLTHDSIRLGEDGPTHQPIEHLMNLRAVPNLTVIRPDVGRPAPEADAALQVLRTRIRDTHILATTAGYGPRFLHSGGQLHKGDRGNGLFIQFTSDPPRDADIPDEAGKADSTMTFGLLKMAQVSGDKRALEDGGRRVIRFHLGSDVVGGLEQLAGLILGEVLL